MADQRYMRKGTSALWWVLTISNKAAPTQAEIAAGVDITGDLAEINGATFANEPIPTPNMKDTFDPSIPGQDTAENPDLRFYERDTATATWTALAKGTVGHLAFLPTGKAATKVSEIWPVTVASRGREWSAGNDPARFRTVFSVNSPPVEGVQAA